MEPIRHFEISWPLVHISNLFIDRTAQGRKSVLKKTLCWNNLVLEQSYKKSFFLERTITNAMYVPLPEKHENSLQHIFFSLKYSRPRISKQVPLSFGISTGDCISLKVRFTLSRKQNEKQKPYLSQMFHFDDTYVCTVLTNMWLTTWNHFFNSDIHSLKNISLASLYWNSQQCSSNGQSSF